jgi:diguanylate cyclase (GGDEF)-like protein
VTILCAPQPLRGITRLVLSDERQPPTRSDKAPTKRAIPDERPILPRGALHDVSPTETRFSRNAQSDVGPSLPAERNRGGCEQCGAAQPGHTGTSLIMIPFTSPTDCESDVQRHVDALALDAYTGRFVGAAQALPVAEEALRIARATGYRLGEARALSASAAIRLKLLDLDRALLEATEATHIFQGLGEATEYASARTIQGNVHRRRGDYGEALRHHFAALEVQKTLNDCAGEAEVRRNIARTHANAGDLARALEEYAASLNLYYELGDEQGASLVRFGMGCVMGDLGQFADALRLHEPALQYFRARGELAMAAASEGNVGVSHWKLGDRDTASVHFDAARALARSAGDLDIEVQVLTIVARLRLETGDSAAALALFREVLAIGDRLNLPVQRAAAYLGIGQVFASMGHREEALSALLTALGIAETGGPGEQRADIHGAIANVYESNGDSERALCHFKTYHALYAQMRSAEADRRLAQLMVVADRRERDRESGHLRERADLLERLSREDSLTGLSNRRDLDERLRAEWARAGRYQHPLSVALADIDHFKSINDRYSHATGDAVLRVVADIMREHTTQNDLVARHGGEEFAFLLVETSIDDARCVCERIRTAVADYDWQSMGHGLGVTVSIGIVDGLAHADPDAAMAAADAQLYRAKRLGRNRLSVIQNSGVDVTPEVE